MKGTWTSKNEDASPKGIKPTIEMKIKDKKSSFNAVEEIEKIAKEYYHKPKEKSSFENLDRASQMKILSTEKKMIKNALEDYILHTQESEIDPLVITSNKSVSSYYHPKDNSNAGQEKQKKQNLRHFSLIPNEPRKEILRKISRRKKRYNSISEMNPSCKNLKKFSIIVHPKKNKKRIVNELSLASNEAQLPKNSCEKKRKSMDSSCDGKDISKDQSILREAKRIKGESQIFAEQIDCTNDGETKLRLSAIEKKTIRQNLLIESVNEQKYPDRELIKRKQVYDSFSDEEVECEEDHYFTIHPKSPFKYIWDFLIFILTCFSIIHVPLSIAFTNHSNFGYDIMNFITDGFFILDFLLNFFMGYFDNEENLILNLKKITWTYFTSWCIVDLISCLPFNTLRVFTFFSQEIYYLCLARLMKYLKVAIGSNMYYYKIPKKIFCFNRGVKRYIRSKIRFNFWTVKLLTNILNFGIIIHILACIWVFLRYLSPGNNWTQSSRALSADNVEINENIYLSSVYFTMVTTFTLGYGDVYPISLEERLYSVILLILALSIYSYIVTFLGNMIQFDSQKIAKMESKLNFLREISISNNVNYLLYEKINNFIKYSSKSSSDEKEQFLDFLPTTLKNQLICTMYKDIIQNFNFFKLHRDDNYDFKSRLLQVLRSVMAYKGEEIIKKHDFVDEVVFLKTGLLSVQILYKKLVVKLLTLRKNEHFGDILMFSHTRSPVTVKVISSHAELLILKESDMLPIIEEFKENFNENLWKSGENMARIMKIIKNKKKQIRRLQSQKKNNIPLVDNDKTNISQDETKNNDCIREEEIGKDGDDFKSNTNTKLIQVATTKVDDPIKSGAAHHEGIDNNGPFNIEDQQQKFLAQLKQNLSKVNFSMNNSKGTSNSGIIGISKQANGIKFTVNVTNNLNIQNNQGNVFLNYSGEKTNIHSSVNEAKDNEYAETNVTPNNNSQKNSVKTPSNTKLLYVPQAYEAFSSEQSVTMSQGDENKGNKSASSTSSKFIAQHHTGPIMLTALSQKKTMIDPEDKSPCSIHDERKSLFAPIYHRSMVFENIQKKTFSRMAFDLQQDKKLIKESRKSLNSNFTTDHTFIDQTLININPKNIHQNIYKTIREKVVKENEEKKINSRLNSLLRNYLNLSSSSSESDDEEEEENIM